MSGGHLQSQSFFENRLLCLFLKTETTIRLGYMYTVYVYSMHEVYILFQPSKSNIYNSLICKFIDQLRKSKNQIKGYDSMIIQSSSHMGGQEEQACDDRSRIK